MVRECDRLACWDEPVFRYLVAVESGRAERTGRPFLVLVADAGSALGVSGLAPALSRSLRESDLVGWHRTDRRAAALLAETAVDRDTARLVGTKVLRSLGTALPAEVARGLRVRIYGYGEAPGARVGFHRLFAATWAGESTATAGRRGVAVRRMARAVLRSRPAAGTLAPDRVGAAARRTPGEASPTPRLAEGAVPQRAGV